ncbi:hypothetical protein B0T22DRAFT_464012 [Podospora appendiculata]|uniref:25S rRNA (Uridine(2843)-N(3))-methyltransferase n=1 Tax=Podospora appendiculata TaxID=314037 RepID=A0AAE0X445_9PEZI|nr:hypothetical protein B0T22DRAFT_464012 [Podospora appendiculata]
MNSTNPFTKLEKAPPKPAAAPSQPQKLKREKEPLASKTGAGGISSKLASLRTTAINTNSSKLQLKKRDTTQEKEQRKQAQRDAVDRRQRQQQQVLNVFKASFGAVLNAHAFEATLQAVKQALFERDFARAFCDPEHLAVYAARWSPTRALCYASILGSLHHQHLLEGLFCADDDEDDVTTANDTTTTTTTEDTNTTPTTTPPNPKKLNVLSIGGGPAELAAFAAFLGTQTRARAWREPNEPKRAADDDDPETDTDLFGRITLLDSAPWASVIAPLRSSLTTAPPLSKYASAAARQAMRPVIPASNLVSSFIQHDALDLGREGLSPLMGMGKGKGDKPLLITLLFTLNELFTSSGIGKTTAFLLDLTSVVPAGSLLLVVDSPGSYSETSVGKAAARKKYPMHWLLDRIMLGTQAEPVGGRRWAKLQAHDSEWFRLADTNTYSEGDTNSLDYPIGLENMRYQMHLYRAEDASVPIKPTAE